MALIDSLRKMVVSRERRIMLAAIIVLSLVLAFVWLGLPLMEARKRLLAELPQLRTEMQQIRAEAAQIAELRKRTRAGIDLAAIVQAEAPRGRGGAPAVAVGEADGRLRVRFDAVGAAEWLAWLAVLQRERRVRVIAAQMEALEPGWVRADVLLQAPR